MGQWVEYHTQLEWSATMVLYKQKYNATDRYVITVPSNVCLFWMSVTEVRLNNLHRIPIHTSEPIPPLKHQLSLTPSLCIQKLFSTRHHNSTSTTKWLTLISTKSISKIIHIYCHLSMKNQDHSRTFLTFMQLIGDSSAFLRQRERDGTQSLQVVSRRSQRWRRVISNICWILGIV